MAREPQLESERQAAQASVGGTLLLGLLLPGSGHAYVGRPGSGLTLALLVSAIATLGSLGAVVTESVVVWWTVVAVGIALVILSAVRAASLAKSGSVASSPHKRWGFVALVVLLLAGSNSARRMWVVESFVVTSPSMSPTLEKGARFVAAKFSERERSPRVGDLVVFTTDKVQPPSTYVKRVVAIGPGRVRFSDRRVEIEGRLVPQTPCATSSECVREETFDGRSYRLRVSGMIPEPPMKTVELAAGELLVLGDNRGESLDSFTFGPVRVSDVVGRVVLRWWGEGLL